jgi:hypothetical protein
MIRASNAPAQPTHRMYSGSGFSLDGRDLEVLGPVHALVAGDAPRVRRPLEVAERALEVGGDLVLFEHQVLAHLHDLERVLDEHRAHLLAGAARGA